MKGVYTPENIDTLLYGQIFVFGSNLAGKHDAGAAKIALEKFGAIYGQGEGLQGRSYAIPTLDENFQKLPLEKVGDHIRTFVVYAFNNMQNLYLVTKIGCGIAGFKTEEIAQFFLVNNVRNLPKNVILPKEFHIYA